VSDKNFSFNPNFKYMNWPFLVLFGLAAVALIVFLVRRNQKDEKKFEKQLNEDFHKSKDEEGDAAAEDAMK
jgi:hypothetical protein